MRDYSEAMQTPNSDHFEKLTVQISKEEKDNAKVIAKSQGMTFQGWIGQLIKNAIKEAREA